MKKGLIALSPLMVFILFYLVTSIIAGDFYKIPITVAFMVSSIYAVIIFNGKPLMARINTFSRGAATEQMMLMIWIFVLAGAFAYSAKQMGSQFATAPDATRWYVSCSLFHIFIHRYECGYDSCSCTYCSRRSRRNGPQHRYDDSSHRGRIVLWR